MAWFDAGINMFDERMPAEQTLSAALAAGVTRLCLITTHPDEWQQAEDYYRQYPDQLCYTLGIHPHNAKVAQPEHFAELRARATQPGVVAIGECGLDYNRDFSPRDVQRQVFSTQLQIAVELNKPVYLHERDAFADQLAILEPVKAQLQGGIAHCFTGNTEQMQAYLALGLHIGITGWVCDDKRGQALREAVLQLPVERLIMETDAPYLYPKDRKPRQRNNAPAYLPHIGHAVAQLKAMAPDRLQEISFNNTEQLFS
ncbi:TatD family hydrolase [Alteromonas lipolytica]|uniref:Hydrolase TatD n=1 Tax=Alteromonas lipolytica TaxID=1856405 RepID=A0A1E8F928_9ALTE|nr:TatD family hydrolase [Alteromonas lipolytica]OFI32410.1 hydrolase TatD [Alteromonas lipolytica]GGF79923.1 DNase TatD [Alteromonas lipolytica]